jgi:hypothetical protein
MGWKNYHLYQFELGRRPCKRVNMTLEVVFSKGVRSLVYEYDMGDGWRHEITLLATVAEATDERPVCLAGARACPPEDCGGPPGYYDLLAALSDPKHEEHDSMLQWVGGRFAPEAFDVAAANRSLKRLR